jgi:uncharacterized protein (DUF2147 family)
MYQKIMPFSSFRNVCIPVALLVLAAGLVHSQTAPAQEPSSPDASMTSPVGRWKTIDDKTGKARGIVDLREEDGKLYGTVESLIDPPVPNPTCYLCSGDLKDRPVVGMQVLWGLVKDGNQWTGGQVLDPESGKSYRASIMLEAGGKKLRMRGYILMPMFGRTQHWIRME